MDIVKWVNSKTYPIDDLLEVFQGVYKAKTEPYRHYREEHDNIPPWILVKKLTFGNLIWWFQLLKGPQKVRVVAKMYDLPENLVSGNLDIISATGAILTLFLDYRNTAAHGGRVYNHTTTLHALPYNGFIHGILKISPADFRSGKGQSRVGVVMQLLHLFENPEPYIKMKAPFDFHVQRYLKLNPNMTKYLEHEMEMDFADK